MYIENCEAAKNHKTIAAFYELALADMSDGLIDFRTIQERRYIPFWGNLAIFRHVNDGEGWEVVLWGGSLVENYGKELTGKLFNPIDLGVELGAQSEKIVADDARVVANKDITFSSGTLSWQNRSYKRWHRMCLPMTKGGDICCFMFIVFS